MSKQKVKNRRQHGAKAPKRAVFPCGKVYEAMPTGARQQTVLWRTSTGETQEVDLELAIETEANMHLVDILKAGKLPSAEDFERCATRPPMSGARLFDLLRRLGAQSEQYAKASAKAQRVRQTSNARRASRENATKRDGRDWRDTARLIAEQPDPRTGKPWRTKERLIEYLMGQFQRSRSAVLRALNNRQ